MSSRNKKFCDCLNHIDSSKVNKYAVCTASVYNKKGLKRPAKAIKNCEKFGKPCPKGYIRNPKSDRCILKDGKLAKKLGL